MALGIDASRLSPALQAGVGEVAEELGLCRTPPFSVTVSEAENGYVFSNGERSVGIVGGRSAFFAALRRAAECGGLPRPVRPAFRSLGFMADCSRNAVLTVASVKKLIRKLALLGYDSLQLYMEDTYEVEGEPYFGYLRGRYSAEELREIAAYGETFGVEFVPAIQTLAHLNAIFRWRPYWEINDCQDILLADCERTYALIEHMLASLRGCVRGRRINIGMDEAHFLGLGKYLTRHGMQDRFQIMLRHLRRVLALCKKYGFEPMMWSDMFYRLTSSACYEEGTGDPDESLLAEMPQDVSLVYWNYYERDGAVYDRMIASHKRFPNPLVFAGGAVKWMGFAPDNRYSLDVAAAALAACKRNGVQDVLLTAWGDNGAECSVFSVLPVAVYYAAFNEGAAESGARCKRMFRTAVGMRWEDFMCVDLPNRLSDSADPRMRSGACKYLLYNDLFLGTMDSTVPEGIAERYAKHARALRAAARRAGEWAYLFETLARLCLLLQKKAALGVRTREAVEAGEDAVRAILAEYSDCERALKKFIAAFRAQWYAENKPHGFDVQEIRLGGLLYRLQSCRARLERFLRDGTPVAELQEELLDYFGGGKEFKKPLDCTDTAWHQLASVNNFL